MRAACAWAAVVCSLSGCSLIIEADDDRASGPPGGEPPAPDASNAQLDSGLLADAAAVADAAPACVGVQPLTIIVEEPGGADGEIGIILGMGQTNRRCPGGTCVLCPSSGIDVSLTVSVDTGSWGGWGTDCPGGCSFNTCYFFMPSDAPVQCTATFEP